MARAARSAKRSHNCQAESNVRMIRGYWRGEQIVTEFGCKRCPNTWEVAKTMVEIEAEMTADRDARLANLTTEAIRRHGR